LKDIKYHQDNEDNVEFSLEWNVRVDKAVKEAHTNESTEKSKENRNPITRALQGNIIT
jgi:hypothetical protein